MGASEARSLGLSVRGGMVPWESSGVAGVEAAGQQETTKVASARGVLSKGVARSQHKDTAGVARWLMSLGAKVGEAREMISVYQRAKATTILDDSASNDPTSLHLGLVGVGCASREGAARACVKTQVASLPPTRRA